LLLQSKVFSSRSISRARALCSLALSLSALCVSLNLSLSFSLSVSLFRWVFDQFQGRAGVTIAAASKTTLNVLQDIASSGSAPAVARNMSRSRRKLGFTKGDPGWTSAVQSPAVSPHKVLAGFERKPEGSKYKAQAIVRGSHVHGQTHLDPAAVIRRREAYFERREKDQAKEHAKHSAKNLLEFRQKQVEKVAKATAIDWAFAHKGAPIVRPGRGSRGQVQYHVRNAGRYTGTDRMKGGLESRNRSRDNHSVSVNIQADFCVWVFTFSISGSISVLLLASCLFSLALRSRFLSLCSLSLSFSAVAISLSLALCPILFLPLSFLVNRKRS